MFLNRLTIEDHRIIKLLRMCRILTRENHLDKLLFCVVLYPMGTGEEFVEQLEVVLGQTVGKIVVKSLLKNQLTKLNKDRGALSSDDCKILIQDIIQSISQFATKEEAARAQSALDKLFKIHFS